MPTTIASAIALNVAARTHRNFFANFTRSIRSSPHYRAGLGNRLQARSNHTAAAAAVATCPSEIMSKATVKVPKGTRDWFGADVLLRDFVFDSLTNVFKRHHGTPLSTPQFELSAILAGKYGEDSKLIYDLKDQGGEICSLRYDLTIPLARWLAMTNTQQVKRYQIDKVYRRDQPAIQRGRMREFWQCDFDICGEYDPMIPDAEIIRIIVEAFDALDLLKDVTIKINHRKILDGLFKVAGVPVEKLRSISSAIDKLDKSPWAEVKREMEEKGLSADIADVIGEYVSHSGSLKEIIKFLRENEKAAANEQVKQGLDDMSLLADYLEAFQAAAKVSFDLALARGLDYYTGVIYEVVMELPPAKNDKEGRIGSIAAGGRYDNLVGMYGKKQIPCVGVSFGVDRIFTILNGRKERGLKVSEIDAFVMAFGGRNFNGMLLDRMAVTRELWDAGIRAEFMAKAKPKLPQQFKAAEAAHAPIAVILGGDEIATGQVRVKLLGLPDDHPEKDGKLVARSKLAAEVDKLLQQIYGGTSISSLLIDE